MRWTSKDEKGMIKEWAEECTGEELEQKYLSLPDATLDSYWHEHGMEDEIIDYDFETIPNLRKMLEQELADELYKDLILPLTIAAFREKKIIEPDTETSQNGEMGHLESDEFSLPEFVYMF